MTDTNYHSDTGRAFRSRAEKDSAILANPAFFKPEFDKLATEGTIGDPNGQSAYAYMRVSGDEQADEGRSGLPRQIGHIHEAALKYGYKIHWESVYADDATGFTFEQRPQLSLLRNELRNSNRRANVVIVEHLDRLSRHADWHQGFLIEEMKNAGVLLLFWKEFTSRIERAVMGAIAQDGMEQAKQRMMEGNLYKARSGRVTARVPAYGYKLVDADGNEGANAKRDSYYAIREDEAAVVRLIFQRLLCGDSMRKIALDLQQKGIKPPKQYKHWEATQVRLFVRNEVYKGDFYAHRWEHKTVTKRDKNGTSRKVTCKVERPREDWIHVSVPPLVSVGDWEAANRMLDMNRKMSRRNAREPYLLTGLVRCAHCGWLYSGTTKRANVNNRKTPYRGYRCPHTGIRPKYLNEHDQCKNGYIPCEQLDGIVWNLVSQALLEPQVLTDALDSDATSERNRQLQDQIDYLASEIERKIDEDEKLLRAYLADAFDEHEFSARRKSLKEEGLRLSDELARLEAEVLTPEQLEERKDAILAMSMQMKEEELPIDPPFELKQRIIKLVVNEITLSVEEGWLKLDGAIRGTYAIESNPVLVVILVIIRALVLAHQQ